MFKKRIKNMSKKISFLNKDLKELNIVSRYSNIDIAINAQNIK